MCVYIYINIYIPVSLGKVMVNTIPLMRYWVNLIAGSSLAGCMSHMTPWWDYLFSFSGESLLSQAYCILATHNWRKMHRYESASFLTRNFLNQYWCVNYIPRFFPCEWIVEGQMVAFCACFDPCRVTWGKTPTLRIHDHILITNGWNSLKLIHNQIRL